jgi:hypothetical protein
MLAKRCRNEKTINIFQNELLNGRCIREAINSGERSFTEFRKLLYHSKRFKAWVGGVDPNMSVMNEYVKSATKGTWADSLPIKALRFAICTATGLASTPGGISATVADTFLLEKIFRGWRPHHFVQGPLARFVDTDP